MLMWRLLKGRTGKNEAAGPPTEAMMDVVNLGRLSKTNCQKEQNQHDEGLRRWMIGKGVTMATTRYLCWYFKELRATKTGKSRWPVTSA